MRYFKTRRNDRINFLILSLQFLKNNYFLPLLILVSSKNIVQNCIDSHFPSVSRYTVEFSSCYIAFFLNFASGIKLVEFKRQDLYTASNVHQESQLRSAEVKTAI